LTLSARDLADLEHARAQLERVSLAARISSAFGFSLEKGVRLLPAGFSGKIQRVSEVAIQKALDTAVWSLSDSRPGQAADRWHKIVAAASGAAGGALGLAALAVELPVSTTVMLRSVADIARSQGERIRSLDARLACMEVFALGGVSDRDDSADTGYFVVRTALANSVSAAARHLSAQGLADTGAPVLVRLISRIAARYGLVVTQKAAAQAVPLIGAAGGALINTLFIDHFQRVAHGHFTIRRLERAYGTEAVREVYERL